MPPALVSNGLLDAAGAAAFTALLVQQTKFLIEYLVKPGDANHDNLIRLYVDLVAMAVVIVAEVVSGTLDVHNGAAWFTAVVQGFGIALAAISGYHLLNGAQPQTASSTSTISPAPIALDEGKIPAAVERSLATGVAAALQTMTRPAGNDISPAPTPVLDAKSAAPQVLARTPSASTAAGPETVAIKASNGKESPGSLASLIMQVGEYGMPLEARQAS